MPPEEPPAPLTGPERRDRVLEGLRLFFGGGTGVVRLSTKHPATGRWTTKSFDYPVELERAVSWIVDRDSAGVNVHVIPYLGESASAKKGTALERRLVHTDVDDPGREGARLPTESEVRSLGGFMVESGTPGHAHVYVPLARSVGVDEHRELCQLLCDYFHGDQGKKNDSDYLRPPGTRNWKHDPPAGVRLLGACDAVPMDPEVLRDKLRSGKNASLTPVQGRGVYREKNSLCDSSSPLSFVSAEIVSRTDLYFYVKSGNRPAIYQSNSEASAAVALHLVRNGFSYEDFDSIIANPGNAVSHLPRYSQDRQHRTRAEWDAAVEKANADPLQHDPAYFTDIIRTVKASVDLPWPGRTGPTDRAVLSALTERAEKLNTIRVTMSTREVAEAAGVSQPTATRALKRLRGQGRIVVEADPSRDVTDATTYRLLQPPTSHSQEAKAEFGVRMDDYWTQLGPVPLQIYQAVKAGAHSPARIAEVTGRHRKTVRKHLKLLQEDGLVTYNDNLNSWMVEPDVDTSRKAHDLGFSGSLDRKRQRHNVQRQLWKKVIEQPDPAPTSERTSPIQFGRKVGEFKKDVP